MAAMEDGKEPCILSSHSGSPGSKSGGKKMFSLKKWPVVAMWSWDIECHLQGPGDRCLSQMSS